MLQIEKKISKKHSNTTSLPTMVLHKSKNDLCTNETEYCSNNTISDKNRENSRCQ